MDENEVEEQEPISLYSEARLKKLRNLKMFQGKSDAEIIDYLDHREPKDEKIEPEEPKTDEQEYQLKFNRKLQQLRREFAVDMNDSNDMESLRALVRLSIQNEEMDIKIRTSIAGKGSEPRDLKNLTDSQRSINMSISDLQDKLGISRKQRKEKVIDDIPQYISSLQRKAKTFWDRTTTPVTCPKCQIELARVWVNFPKVPHKLSFEGNCWKCEEGVIFNA